MVMGCCGEEVCQSSLLLWFETLHWQSDSKSQEVAGVEQHRKACYVISFFI
jgi:hypothetical protein